MTAVDNDGTDYIGVYNPPYNGANWLRKIYIMYNTFTGFHRCFTDDIEFKKEDPQKFKDDYVGRIVVSSGKIATDLKKIDDEEWTILYDKEGITIEDSLPIIRLSRTKKDKRVFGVLGMASRNNSRAERMIVNSVGEGAMWICNSLVILKMGIIYNHLIILDMVNYKMMIYYIIIQLQKLLCHVTFY